MYRIPSNDPITGESRNVVIRLSDNASIPFDTDNRDFQEYCKWLEAGNRPELGE